MLHVIVHLNRMIHAGCGTLTELIHEIVTTVNSPTDINHMS